MKTPRHKLAMLACVALWSVQASAQNAGDLAKQLANPVASLISVPFQLNYDHDIGPNDDGDRFTLNIQPVIPIGINHDWNPISRTIIPVIDQQDIFPGAGSQSGLGDIVQSAFFSPKAPTANGWIWGAGPVLLIPSASDALLGADQWCVGPPLWRSSRRVRGPTAASSTTSCPSRETTTGATSTPPSCSPSSTTRRRAAGRTAPTWKRRGTGRTTNGPCR